MADDLKVRLSAEGVQDIIAAFNQIRDTAKTAGKEGAEGFTGAFTSGLKELQSNLLGFLGIGEVINSVHELFTEVTQGAVSLDKLHQTTGLSTDALQALNAVAKENLISQESLDKGLQIMSRTLGQAETGSDKAQKALGTLGIQMKDLQGLNADQQFQLIAERLAAIEDPAQRAAAGAAIFGRSFAQIAPAIIEVAEKGIGPFLDKLKQLGVYLDGDMIAQLKGVQRNLNEVGEEAKGMATQFLAGFVPSLTTATNALLKATTSTGSGFTTMGDVVGKVMNGILLQIVAVGKGLGALGATIGTIWDSDKFSDWKTLPGKLAGIWKDFGKDVASSANSLFSPPSVAPGKPGAKSDGTGDSEDSDQVNKAHLSLIQARLQAELALYNAQSKLKMDAEKQSFDEGLISLDKYYADRQGIIQGQYAKEIQILQQHRAAVAAEPIKAGDQAGALRQQAELATLDGQIAAKRVEEHAAVMSNITEENAARKKLQDSELATELKLLELSGKKADAQRLELGLEAQKLAQSLQKGGASADQVSSAVGGFAAQGAVQIDFSETRSDADAAFTDLQTKINAIKAQVASGQLFPIQGEQQMQQAIVAMLPSLQQYADQLQVLANATKTDQNPLGNPQLITQAGQFKEKIDALKLSTDTYGQALANLKKVGQDALTTGLGTALANVLTGTQKVGTAFASLGLNLAQTMIKLETQFAASQFLKWLSSGNTSGASSSGGFLSSLGGLLGGGAGAAQGAIATTANTTAVGANTTSLAALIIAIQELTVAISADTTASAGSDISDYVGLASDALYAADGGHLVGPSHAGGGIMVEAEGGEFIVNKSAVSRPGVRPLLEMINGMNMPAVRSPGMSGLPAFGSGGSVAGAALAGGGVHTHLKVVNLLDADDLVDHIASSHKFDKTIVNSVIRNGNIVKAGINQ